MAFFCCRLIAEGRNTLPKMAKVEASWESTACLAAGVFSSTRSALNNVPPSYLPLSSHAQHHAHHKILSRNRTITLTHIVALVSSPCPSVSHALLRVPGLWWQFSLRHL